MSLRSLLAAYQKSHGFSVLTTDLHGKILDASPAKTSCACRNTRNRRRIDAAKQTLLWGEAVIDLCCPNGFAMWAVPLTHNAEITGALVVQGVDLEAGGGEMPKRVRRAAEELLRLCLRQNLTNSAAITIARQRARRESERFLAIEASKSRWMRDDLRTLYQREEPALLLAIKEGDTGTARQILNRILAGIYAVSGDRLELLKSCMIELVVMMGRAAVEAGAEPVAIFGANYRRLSALASIRDEETLSAWLRDTLDSVIEGIRRNEMLPNSYLLQRAFSHMRNHLDEPLRRDDVARIAGISPGHFSRLVTERMGQSFSDLLTQMRVDRAKKLILDSGRNFTAIALDCGFCDQSHLNKHFRKATGLSPGEYRGKMRTAPPSKIRSNPG